MGRSKSKVQRRGPSLSPHARPHSPLKVPALQAAHVSGAHRCTIRTSRPPNRCRRWCPPPDQLKELVVRCLGMHHHRSRLAARVSVPQSRSAAAPCSDALQAPPRFRFQPSTHSTSYDPSMWRHDLSMPNTPVACFDDAHKQHHHTFNHPIYPQPV